MARIDMPYGANVAVPGEYSLIQAPLSNKSNPTSGGFNNLMVVEQNQPVRIVDNSGEVIFEGIGPEAARKAVAIGQSITDTQGNKAGYEIQTVPVGTETFKTIATEKVNQSTLDAIGDVLGDAALGFVVGGPLGAAIAAGASTAGVNVSDIAYPIIGSLTPLGPIAGAAAGSAVSGAVQGRPIEDILTRAAITAGTAGLMKGTPIGRGISKGIGGALSDIGLKPAFGDIVNAITGSAVPQAIGDEIIVNAITDQLGSGLASGVVGSGIGNGLGSLAPQIPAAPEAYTPPTEQPGEIVVTGRRPVDVVSGIGGATGGGTNSVTGEQNDIVVTADGQVQGLTPPVIPDVGPFDVSTDITNTVKDVQVPSVEKPPSVLDYVRTAGDVVRVIDAIAGGGGGDGGTLGPDNSAISYNALNRKQLTREPAGAGLGSYGFDPFTYGRAEGDQPGEYVFFEAAPAAAPTAPVISIPTGAIAFAEGGDVDDDMVKHLIEYRKGGGHNGPGKVKGIGSGQEDKIPAWLSDGEYVWSAQDVADLGDGSTDEGVRRLDKMRQMVRHRAGRKDVKKIAKPQKGIESLLAAVGGK